MLTVGVSWYPFPKLVDLLEMKSLNDFFVLEHPDVDSRVWVWVELSKRVGDIGPDAAVRIMDEAARPTIRGDPLPADISLPLRVVRGTKWSDVVGSSGAHVLSTRLATLLQQHNCSGLQVQDAVAYDVLDNNLVNTELQWARILPGCGPVDTARGYYLLSTELWKRDIEMREAVGLFFDPLTWTGADIFRSPRGTHVFITSRIAALIANSACDALHLQPASTFGQSLRDKIVMQRKQWLSTRRKR